MLQVFSLALFEKITFHELFFGGEEKPTADLGENRQLDFFDFME